MTEYKINKVWSVERKTTRISDNGTTPYCCYYKNVISIEKILELFFKLHDPTQKDMQFPDVGTQYRSEIFYENDEQRDLAFKIKDKFNKIHNNKIETNISPIKNYCKAEEYHQNYYQKNFLKEKK